MRELQTELERALQLITKLQREAAEVDELRAENAALRAENQELQARLSVESEGLVAFHDRVTNLAREAGCGEEEPVEFLSGRVRRGSEERGSCSALFHVAQRLGELHDRLTALEAASEEDRKPSNGRMVIPHDLII